MLGIKFFMRNTIFFMLLAAAMFQASAMAGDLNVPLTINIVFQEKTGPKPECPSQFGGTLTGTGAEANLGLLVVIATDCVMPTQNYFVFSNGRLIVTISNGDQLLASYTGSFVPTGDGANYVFSGATFQITGGTGRFAQASGGGDLIGTENIQTGMGAAQLRGSISYARNQP